MSSPSLFKPLHGVNDYGVAIIAFSFLTNSTSEVDATTIRGEKVASVTRAGVGSFTVTLDSGYAEILSATAAIRDASTPVGDYATVYIADDAANPLVMVVSVWDDTGTALETTSRRVSVVLHIRVSSVGT